MSGVLEDTSIWVAHFRHPNALLQSLLTADRILCHPLIVLEVACGTPPAPRQRTIDDFRSLRQVVVATVDETVSLVEDRRLYDSGCGAVDVSLLASVMLTPDARLWTTDRSLDALAKRLRVAFDPARH